MDMGRAWWGLWLAVLVGCGTVPLEEEAPEPEPRELRAQRQEGRGAVPRGTTQWARLITGSGIHNVIETEQDRDGNIIVLTVFDSTIDFGGGPLSTSGNMDKRIALAKYQPDGRLLWVKTFKPSAVGESRTVFATALAVDRERNIYFAGEHAGTIDFGGRRLDAGNFLVKLDKHGRHVWSRELGGGAFVPWQLEVDRTGHAVAAGFFERPLDLGRGRIHPPETTLGQPLLVARFEPDGDLDWTHVTPGFFSVGLAVDSEDAAYIGSARLLEGTPFLFKLSPRGHLEWTRSLAGANGFLSGIAVHGNRVVATGGFSEEFTFGGRRVAANDTPASFDGLDTFLVAYTREGEERWARNFGWYGADVAMDPEDGVVVTGWYEDGDDLGRGPLVGDPDILNSMYVAKFNRIDGTPLWARGFITSKLEDPEVSVNRRGESVVFSHTRFPVDFGTGLLTPEPLGDLFLLKLER